MNKVDPDPLQKQAIAQYQILEFEYYSQLAKSFLYRIHLLKNMALFSTE
jgi:hypothetical protein